MLLDPAYVPNEDAQQFLRDKAPLAKSIFAQLLPELRARAFAIQGIESFDVLQGAQEIIARVARGEDWETARAKVQQIMQAELPITPGQARRRAEMLVRFHVFHAYGVARWQAMQAQADVFPYVRYMTAGDERVRASHRALNGLILPISHPFVQSHWTGWEPGCRCLWVGQTPEDMDEYLAAGADNMALDKLGAPVIPTGPVLQRLEQTGFLFRGPGPGSSGEEWDVRSPKERGLSWHNDPTDLRLPLQAVLSRYDAATAARWEAWARATRPEGLGMSLWDWLSGGGSGNGPATTPQPPAPAPAPAPAPQPAAPKKRAPRKKAAPAPQPAPAPQAAPAPAPKAPKKAAAPKKAKLDNPDGISWHGVKKDTAAQFEATLAAHLTDFPELARASALDFCGTSTGWARQQAPQLQKQMEAAHPWATPQQIKAAVRKTLRRRAVGSAYGDYHPATKHVRVNTTYFKDAAAYLAGREKEIAAGSKVPVRRVDATLIHELGHALDWWLGVRQRPAMRALWNQGRPAVAAQISGYASTHDYEMIAEGWAEYYAAKLEGTQPRAWAQQIGQEVEKAYTEWKAANP